MNNFDKSVPFDPGYSRISFSFLEQISYITANYQQLKATHQKKFWLAKLEPSIIESIDKSSAFYLGCMLWGGFIHSRFKDSPKEILGNNINKMSESELQDFDCAVEVKAILEYIESFNRDCKYFFQRPAKISPVIKEILENYIEFAQINNNFIGITNTSDIKLPKALDYFKNLSNEQLDALCDKIYAAIDLGKIEKLLDIRLVDLETKIH